MIRKFLGLTLGGGSKPSNEDSLREAEKALALARKQIDSLSVENMGFRRREKQSMKVISTDIGDPAPTDEKARKAYVAEASRFYEGILEAKMRQMIAETREAADSLFVEVPQGMTRADYDWVLKGTTNAFKLLMDWGENMRGEHLANTTIIEDNN